MAVKLIHPHVADTVKHDMYILRIFVWLVEKIPGVEYMSLSRVVEQFASSMQVYSFANILLSVT